ncbi:MAG: hypothetical protein V1936_04075 [Patescibacteria group bacterium]
MRAFNIIHTGYLKNLEIWYRMGRFFIKLTCQKNPNRPKLGSGSRDHIKNLLKPITRPIGKRTAKPDLLAGQPDLLAKARQRIKGLTNNLTRKKDDYKYLPSDPEKGGQPTLEVAGKRFVVEIIEHNDKETLDKVRNLLMTQFEPDEVDSVKAMQNLLASHEEAVRASKEGDQKTLVKLGGAGSPYYTLVLRDEGGELAAVLQGSLAMPKEKSANKFLPAGQAEIAGATFHTGYIVVRNDLQQKHIGTALYEKVLPDIVRNDTGMKLGGIISEATDDGVELFNNKSIDKRRVYTQDKSGNYKEITYHQLALDFDANGKAVSGDVLEHLMLKKLGSKANRIPVGEVMDAAFRMWLSFNVKNEAYFIEKQKEVYQEKHGSLKGFNPNAQFRKDQTKRACQENLAYVQKRVREFQARLEEAQELYLLTQTERVALEQQGKMRVNRLYAAKHAKQAREKDPNYFAA